MHGGFLLSIAREAAYQSDIRAGDRVLFATDMGWIMGPWTVVGAGALGAAVIYMEGAPDRPDDRLWKLVEEERVTMLGVSPTLVRALIPKGVPDADLSSLRSITTTGEPWNAGPYEWLNEHVAGGGRIPIVNISGGTEVGACFLSVALTDADEAGLARLPGARPGDGRLLAGGRAAPRRGRRARLHPRLAGDDTRRSGGTTSATSRPTGAASPASGRTATGPRSTRTATGSCTAARTTRSTSPASGSGRPSSSRPRSTIPRSPRRPRSASRTR